MSQDQYLNKAHIKTHNEKKMYEYSSAKPTFHKWFQHLTRAGIMYQAVSNDTVKILRMVQIRGIMGT